MNKDQLIEKHGSIRAAARELGVPESTLRCRLKKDEGIETDALTEACEMMGIKQEEAIGGWIKSPEASIWLKREPKSVEKELSADFITLLESARRHVVRGPESTNADSMLVISPVDAHFGKLSYSKETGQNYDPEITSLIYRQAVADSLKFFRPERVKKIVIQVGHDLLNADNSNSQTTAGTVVASCDTRYTKVFDIAVAAVIAAIEDCVQIADVLAVCVPGNHDTLTSCLLAKVVKQYFRDDPRVTVDDDEILRKYVRFGTNLIGMTHKFTKFDTAPIIMATERPEDWGETTCREYHTGHLHTTRAKSWTPYYEVSGVVVRITSALSATDLWSYANGYIGNCRACESWIYSETDGMYGMHVAKVRQ